MERDKALDMAVGQIEKQFGKGAVMRLGDQANQTVASIPTGAISLDLALGVGGIPRGRVTEIYGPEASGKCLVADAYVWSDRGLETVEEVFERCGQPASCTSRVTDVRGQGLRAVNERGELEGVAALTHNNRKPVVRVQLRTGRSIEVTHNHPLRVVSERGFVEWRQAGQIREGDTVVSAAFGAEEAAEGDGLDEDEAVLLGYLTAEGSLSNRTAIRFPSWDPEVGQDFTDVVSRVFDDVEVRCDGGKEYVVAGKAARDELEARYGLGFGVAAAKHVPQCIRTAGAKMQRAFLSALFEADGWTDGSSTIGLASASHELAEQVQLLLLGLGIPASLSARWNASYERDSWTVTINPACVGRFIDEIGFRSARRQRQVEASFRRSPQDPQLERVPDIAGLDEPRYILERVERVEDGGNKPTFDLMLPDSHSFLANGVLSHNTTVALHVVAEAQLAGGIAAFIDAEHALDPSYAKALGVDTEELLVSQPDTGEQALEIADMLVRSGAVDVIVIDSVAALTPRAEIEGEMGDSHVGLQARLMSQALRKLSGTLHRSRTSAVFINQLREKVGVMFGSPETTPGGRALKFYSSVRLDVRRIESLKDGNEAIGNRVRAKVVKNKCVAAGTRVFDAATGETVPIEDIVENQREAMVWAADKRGQLHLKPVTGWFEQGDQEVVPLSLQDGTTIRVTPDHFMLTDDGWRQAGDLTVGDRLARPRVAGGFGDAEPVAPESARMLGYLIGGSCVGGKAPTAVVDAQPTLTDDAEAIASRLGCVTDRRMDGSYLAFPHRRGEKNGVLELVRWAGIGGHPAPDERIPEQLLKEDVAESVLGNLLFGLWETDGWISREQTGGIRCGYTTTSEQLAWQVHWLLLRWGIGSSVRRAEPGSRRSVIDGRRVSARRPVWEARVSGLDNVERLAEALPLWGPRGERLQAELAALDGTCHRGSARAYLPDSQTGPVLEYLTERGVTAVSAAKLIGDGAGDPKGGLKQVLGSDRLRRDRVEKLEEALDSSFLKGVLDEDVFYDRIDRIGGSEREATYDIEVADLHNFVAEDVVVHNCAPPFKQAEFDIMYGTGISKQGALLDLGVDHGVVKKAGAWYTYDGEQLGQGRENAKKFLGEHDDVAEAITKQLHEQLGLVPTDVTGDEAVSEDGEAGQEAEGAGDGEAGGADRKS